MKVGIIGNGYVGKATSMIIPSAWETLVYDIDPKKSIPEGMPFEGLEYCDVVFICVPTPLSHARCYTKYIEDILIDMKRNFHTRQPHKVVRSTVPPGTCHRLDANFIPEFLTEANWEDDIKNTDNWIVGTNDPGETVFKKLITSMLEESHKEDKIKGASIHFTATSTAEMTKYTSNCFFSTKVSFFNEIYSFCESEEIPYDEMIELLLSSSRERVSENHTKVPGPDGKKGFGGTCLPKDLTALIYEFRSKKIPCPVMGSVLSRNNRIDRKDRDWQKDRGRTVI